MSAIEDLTHQLFTLVLKEVKAGNSISFENSIIQTGRGPISRNSDGMETIDLSGQCGLLGHSHPVIIKAILKCAISGSLFLEDSRRLSAIDKIQRQLSEMIGVNIYLVDIGSDEKSDDYLPGRTTGFLDTRHLDNIKKGKTVVLKKILPEDIGINISQKGFSGLRSALNLEISSSIIRFLSEAGFYDENGLIKNREQMIYSTYKKCLLYESNHGLIVNLKDNPKSSRLRFGKERLIFPLSFNEEILSTIFNYLEDSKCS
jgi:hypothetical protein